MSKAVSKTNMGPVRTFRDFEMGSGTDFEKLSRGPVRTFRDFEMGSGIELPDTPKL